MLEHFNELSYDFVRKFRLVEVDPNPHRSMVSGDENFLRLHHGNDPIFVRKITAEMETK